MALISLVDILSGISASLLRLRINTLMNFLRLVPCSQAWSSTSLGFYLRFQSRGVLMTRWALCCENCFGAGLGTTASRNTDETAFPSCPHPSYFYKFILWETFQKIWEQSWPLRTRESQVTCKSQKRCCSLYLAMALHIPRTPWICWWTMITERSLWEFLFSQLLETHATYFRRGTWLADSLESAFRLSTLLSFFLGCKLPTGSLIPSPQHWTMCLAPSFRLTYSVT